MITDCSTSCMSVLLSATRFEYHYDISVSDHTKCVIPHRHTFGLLSHHVHLGARGGEGGEIASLNDVHFLMYIFSGYWCHRGRQLCFSRTSLAPRGELQGKGTTRNKWQRTDIATTRLNQPSGLIRWTFLQNHASYQLFTQISKVDFFVVVLQIHNFNNIPAHKNIICDSRINTFMNREKI